jgi:hypothetical protein
VIRTIRILLGLTLLAAATVAVRPAVAAAVLAESQTSVAHPVATVRAALDWRQRYTLQVDGPAGATFSVAAVESYVDAGATLSGSADRSAQFQGTAPYTAELIAPQANLRYWRYAAVVTPTGGENVVVRIVAPDVN